MRRSLVEPDQEELSISRQCSLLGISRSAYYYRPTGVSAQDLERMRILDEVFTKRPYFGSRRLGEALQERGDHVGRDHVRTLMQRVGLAAVYPKKRLSVPEEGRRVYPYLLRALVIERPDQVWCSDITYIRLWRGFAYLVAVMDWYSRYVLAWELSLSLEGSFCVAALQAALVVSTPEVFNSDQGSQYTAAGFTQELLGRGVRISMDGRGRAFDNVMIERLWRTVKYEEVYLKEYAHFFAARESLGEYFRFYNEERRHSGLDGRTPSAAYWRGHACARKAG